VKKKPTKQEVAERQIKRGEIAKARMEMDKSKMGMEKLHAALEKLADEAASDPDTDPGTVYSAASSYADALISFKTHKNALFVLTDGVGALPL
jgi:hypothetical protein